MGSFKNRAAVGLVAPNLEHLTKRTDDERGPQHAGFTVHHVGDNGALYRPDPLERLREIQREHMEVRGYGDIAYHGAWDADGNTYGLRDAHFVGAHASSTNNVANRLTDGLVFLEDKRGWTADAAKGFQWWRNLYVLAHKRPAHLAAHEWWRHVGGIPTACPGGYLITVVRQAGGLV